MPELKPAQRGNPDHALDGRTQRLPVLSPAYLSALAGRIKEREQEAVVELYHSLSRGIRWHLARKLRTSDPEDYVQEIFMAVITAIQSGSLRDPERLLGYTSTIVKRTALRVIEERIADRSRSVNEATFNNIIDARSDPEQQLIHRRKVEVMKRMLLELSDRDREILVRFYLHEQTKEQICSEMNLNETQFRLAKSRAKGKLENKVRQRTLTGVMAAELGLHNRGRIEWYARSAVRLSRIEARWVGTSHTFTRT